MSGRGAKHAQERVGPCAVHESVEAQADDNAGDVYVASLLTRSSLCVLSGQLAKQARHLAQPLGASSLANSET